jgi:hypothetical protein
MSEDNKHNHEVEPDVVVTPSENLEGLRANRDSILAEKKALEKRLKKFETEAEEKAKKELEETGKFKELYEKSNSELSSIKRRIEFEKAARKHAFDTDYSDVFLGRAQFDTEGKLVDADKFFSELKNERPKLFNEDKKEIVPTDTSKPKADAAKFTHIYTRKELNEMSQEDYEKVKAIVLKQSAQGLIN